MAMIDPLSLDDRLRAALREDLGEAGDVTTNAVFAADHTSGAVLVAKADGVLSASGAFARVFALIDERVSVAFEVNDGARVAKGQVVARLSGATRALLAGERTALNILQRMSGIATLTARYVAAGGGRIAIVDTRKTTPLWRDLEKQAVADGGGVNHRIGLYDMVMLKDTHADGAGGLAEALRRVHAARTGLRIAAEARTLDEVRAAIDGRADLVMLDNMDDTLTREAVALIAGRAEIELTGNMTPERIARLADCGAQRISVGALTHSAPALDFSMKISLGG